MRSGSFLHEYYMMHAYFSLPFTSFWFPCFALLLPLFIMYTMGIIVHPVESRSSSQELNSDCLTWNSVGLHDYLIVAARGGANPRLLGIIRAKCHCV
ncbi:hypothetical protein BDN67DRAFT_1850 [Paxillus ammoniavirescens]|nr:hypothetical protein BDN67DRAFT_1850 [Paxillus ammoniavirescens]